jgi:hypothetical protein
LVDKSIANDLSRNWELEAVVLSVSVTAISKQINVMHSKQRIAQKVIFVSLENQNPYNDGWYSQLF